MIVSSKAHLSLSSQSAMWSVIKTGLVCVGLFSLPWEDTAYIYTGALSILL